VKGLVALPKTLYLLFRRQKLEEKARVPQ